MTRWRVFITPAAERALKGLPRDVEHFILGEFAGIIRRNPFAGTQLSGPLAWLHSFHFTIGGQPYRVAYSIDRTASKILVHFVGHRSGFYERVRKRLGW